MKLQIQSVPLYDAIAGNRLTKYYDDFKALAAATSKDRETAKCVVLPDNKAAIGFVNAFNRYLKGTGLCARRRAATVYCYHANGKSNGSTSPIAQSGS